MRSILLSGFDDAINAMRNFFGQIGGTTTITIIICVLAVSALILAGNMIKASVSKGKFVVNWLQLFLLIVLIVVIVWLCLMYK